MLIKFAQVWLGQKWEPQLECAVKQGESRTGDRGLGAGFRVYGFRGLGFGAGFRV